MMTYLLYGLSALSCLLAIGGLAAYAQTKQIGLLISSIFSIAGAAAAIVLVSWWPLVIAFAANWGLKLAGLDPGSRG